MKSIAERILSTKHVTVMGPPNLYGVMLVGETVEDFEIIQEPEIPAVLTEIANLTAKGELIPNANNAEDWGQWTPVGSKILHRGDA